MEDAPGTAARALELRARLRENGREFGFFQALRRLESVYPESPRIGTSKHPADDPVRLGQEPSMAFAPTTIAAFEDTGHGKPRLLSYFLGLLGPNGPLPLHLTEFVRDRQRNAGDPTFARFLDVFHHRMLGLFYRAWAMNEPAVSFDRPAEDRFGTYVAALFGLGMPSLRGRDAFPDLARLYFAGRFAAQTRHADGLKAILAGFFRMPVAIVEQVGDWLNLAREQRCRLGESAASGTLGRTAAIGARVWSRQHKFRIRFGPLSLAQYQRLLPGNDSLERLVPLIRSYVGDELAWEVNLVLRGDEIPAPRLGRGVRLGWTTWLASKPRAAPADDLRLTPCGS